jgi:hypothetical protein
MTDNDGLIVRLLTRWQVYESKDNSHIQVQSWRFIRRVRRVIILSFRGGAHELWAEDLKGPRGALRLTNVLLQHAKPSEVTEKLKKASNAISNIT